jgi:hypothetical protein
MEPIQEPREATMNGQLIAGNPLRYVFALALALLLVAGGALAQVPVDENGDPIGTWQADGADRSETPASGDSAFSAAELEELVGPVALYPDDLLAIVLPASTYPLEIVQAARFLDELERDGALKPDDDWDDSVVALLNYPDVVRMMNDDIDWTWRLGEAVISQQNEVIAAVESFRDRAYAAGNLKTDERQKVSYEDGIIEIVPVNEEIIYVPYYEPAEVVVRQPRPVYYYYPDPYPVYYYPYPVGYRFHSHYFWGVTTAFTIGWPNHYVHVYHPSYWGHPYYGRYYYGHYYRRPSITVYNNWYVRDRYRTPRHRYRDGDYWRPRHRAGARQYEQRVINRHYASSQSRNRPNRSASRRETVRSTADGRMDLNLRDRGTRRTAVNNVRRENPAGSRATTANSRSQSVDRTNRVRQDTVRTRGAEGRRQDVAAHSPRQRTAGPRSTERRQAQGISAVSHRPDRAASNAGTQTPRRTAAPAPPRVADVRRSAQSASRQSMRATEQRKTSAPARREAGSRKRNRHRD